MNRRDRRIANALQALAVATRMVREARTTIRREIVAPAERHAVARGRQGHAEADVKAARRLMRLED